MPKSYVALTERPLREVIAGYRRHATTTIQLDDARACRFCEREPPLPFKTCCRNVVEARIARAHRAYRAIEWVYDPGDAALARTNDDADIHKFDALFKISPIEKYTVTIAIPADAKLDDSDDDAAAEPGTEEDPIVVELRRRLDRTSVLHATAPAAWDYLGYLQTPLCQVGILVFGEITLDAAARALTGKALSRRRATHLARILSRVCAGLDFPEPSVVADPDPASLSPDDDAEPPPLDPLGAPGASPAPSYHECAACGRALADDTGRGGPKKCSVCRTVRYCSKECQRKHWKTHKPRCAKLAAQREREAAAARGAIAA
mmetsp:Transcript_15961/g.64407  ORF Transcript_15961/g.64407 Transcript_15961/m.64407 type:complete len:319 (-) Transcript_15961:155-1111(-)